MSFFKLDILAAQAPDPPPENAPLVRCASCGSHSAWQALGVLSLCITCDARCISAATPGVKRVASRRHGQQIKAAKRSAPHLLCYEELPPAFSELSCSGDTRSEVDEAETVQCRVCGG